MQDQEEVTLYWAFVPSPPPLSPTPLSLPLTPFTPIHLSLSHTPPPSLPLLLFSPTLSLAQSYRLLTFKHLT